MTYQLIRHISQIIALGRARRTPKEVLHVSYELRYSKTESLVPFEKGKAEFKVSCQTAVS